MGCTAAAALGLGGLLPLLSITMERFQIPGYLIGINAMMPFLSAMLVMPFLPKIMAKTKTAPLLLTLIILSSFLTLLYGVFLDFYVWFPLRFLNGIALGMLFAISEAWINHFAEEKYRGRIIAIYATILSGCFAFGPAILWIAGTEGIAPYALCAILMLIAPLPVIGAWNLPQAFAEEPEAHHVRFRQFFFIAPTLMLAGVVYGGVEIGILTFMPIYGLRLGLSEMLSAAALTAFSLGNICCQIPIGYLADKYDRMTVLFLCAAIASLSALAMPLLFFAAPQMTPLVILGFAFLLFIFGGFAVGIYTLAMILIGERFAAAALAGANAALVFCYNLGSLLTPPTAGVVMDSVPVYGLPLLLAAITGSVLTRPLWRKFFQRPA